MRLLAKGELAKLTRHSMPMVAPMPMDHDSIAGAEEFPAVLVRDGQSRDITLYLKALSPEERTLLMEGCLINHYAAQRGQNHV